MTHHQYMTSGTCARIIEFDLDGEVVHNIKFYGGCDGNLKAISKAVDGWTVDKIEETFAGNLCGMKPTSCADQLAKAVRHGLKQSK